MNTNPAQTYLNVELKCDLRNKEYRYIIHSLTGQKMVSGEIGSSITEINVNHLTSGLYMVKFSNEKKIVTKHFSIL